MTTSTGSAPGRLDLLGGVADYAGSLVLEVPTRARLTVVAEAADAFEVGGVVLAPTELAELASSTDDEVRARLAAAPSWTRYPIGVTVMLVRHGIVPAPAVRLTVASEVPIAMGASSSAALEVATARALGAHHHLAPLELATLCQAAENRIVGAPCGIMDQVAVTVGEPGCVLPIVCRPASPERPVALPPGVELVGWPSGTAHDVGGDPYGRARAASFMGKRIAEALTGRRWAWTSQIPTDLLPDLPDEIEGATFLDRYGSTGDDLAPVDPQATYPVRAATAFGVEEHQRCTEALDHLRGGAAEPLRPLMSASHHGYGAMGLGHPATDRLAAEALDRPGVLGARTSAGGSGGTVVVLCRQGALDDVDGLIR